MAARLPRPVWALAAILLAGGCGKGSGEPEGDRPENDPPPPHDPDVVLLVDDVEIRGSEVQVVADAIAEMFPEYTPIHCRRIALRNVFLPRAAVSAAHSERRAEALLECERAREALRTDPASGEAESQELRGDFRRLELGLWVYARSLEPGVWSPPFEQIGRLRLVQLAGIEEGEEKALDVVSVRVHDFLYLPEGSTMDDVEAAIDASRLSILDPDWGKAVSELTKYRMREEAP